MTGENFFDRTHFESEKENIKDKVFVFLMTTWFPSFFATGFPVGKDIENFHNQPKESAEESLKITWDPKGKTFICSSQEPTQLVMEAIKCRNPNSCELVRHCFDVVRISSFIFYIFHYN